MDLLIHEAKVLYNYKYSKIFLKNVQFHGIVDTKKSALIAEIGELYNSQTFDELVEKSYLSAQHMQEVGLFENCVPIIDCCSDNKMLYTVNFFVKEPKSFNVSLKLGMTMTGNADAIVNGKKKNLFGRGESGEISYTKSMRESHSFDFRAVKPFLGWQKYSNIGVVLSRNFDYLKWNKTDVTQNYLMFQQNNRFFSNSLQHSLLCYLSWRYFQPKNNAPFQIREQAGHTSKISFEQIIAYDTRNNFLLPSRGLFGKIAIEWAGILGDSAFLKTQTDFQAATPLLYGFFFGVSLKSIMIHSLAHKAIHLLDRVYMGGPHDIRGFELNSLGTKVENAPLGGAFGCAMGLHLYRSLVPVNYLFGHLFFTGGSVSSVSSRTWLKDVIENPKASIGFGLTFIFRNIVRLELNYVYPIWKMLGDCCSSGLHFGAGLNFL